MQSYTPCHTHAIYELCQSLSSQSLGVDEVSPPTATDEMLYLNLPPGPPESLHHPQITMLVINAPAIPMTVVIEDLSCTARKNAPSSLGDEKRQRYSCP